MNNDPDLGIVVPLEDGTMAPIDHLPLSTPTKKKGSTKCPTGGIAGSFTQMKENTVGWIEKVRARKLQ
jgi:hypothetical protein